jgi:hypothetical protein
MLAMLRHGREHLVRALAITPAAGGGHVDSTPQEPLLPPLPGRAEVEPAPIERAWPRERRASRTSSPSSEGMRGRWILLLRLEVALALAWLLLAASLNDTIVPRVGGREDAEDDGAIEVRRQLR